MYLECDHNGYQEYEVKGEEYSVKDYGIKVVVVRTKCARCKRTIAVRQEVVQDSQRTAFPFIP